MCHFGAKTRIQSFKRVCKNFKLIQGNQKIHKQLNYLKTSQAIAVTEQIKS